MSEFNPNETHGVIQGKLEGWMEGAKFEQAGRLFRADGMELVDPSSLPDPAEDIPDETEDPVMVPVDAEELTAAIAESKKPVVEAASAVTAETAVKLNEVLTPEQEVAVDRDFEAEAAALLEGNLGALDAKLVVTEDVELLQYVLDNNVAQRKGAVDRITARLAELQG